MLTPDVTYPDDGGSRSLLKKKVSISIRSHNTLTEFKVPLTFNRQGDFRTAGFFPPQ